MLDTRDKTAMIGVEGSYPPLCVSIPMLRLSLRAYNLYVCGLSSLAVQGLEWISCEGGSDKVLQIVFRIGWGTNRNNEQLF